MNIFEEWLEKEKLNFSKSTKKRKYLHFDRKIKPSKSLIYISKPEEIISHSFYPFIESIIEIPRFKFDKETQTRKVAYKKRPIKYAAHIDSYIYSWYSYLISKNYEQKLTEHRLEKCAIAYRRVGKNFCNINFAKEVFDFIKSKGECGVLCFDIESFFDTIKHEVLKKAWAEVLGYDKLPDDHYKIFKSLTKYAYVNRKHIYEIFDIKKKLNKNKLSRICTPKEFRDVIRNNKLVKKNEDSIGIPQGSPISGLLANIYLLNFDRDITEFLNSTTDLYRRYSDDLIVVCDIKDMGRIKEFIIKNIREKYKLEIQESKTDETVFSISQDIKLQAHHKNGKKKNLQYLGFEFDGENSFIRSSSISRYYRKMKWRVSKTVRKSLSKNKSSNRIFKRKLYEQNTHLGSKNFISYVYRSEKIFNEQTIRRQIKSHWKKLHREIDSKLGTK